MDFIQTRSDIPKRFRDIIGDNCEYCGAPIIVSETGSIVRCINDNCNRKLAGSLVKMKDKIGIKDYGLSSALTYIRSNRIENISDILKNPPIEFKEEFIDYMSSISTIPEIIEFLGIPKFKESAKTLFSNYSTFEEFFDECFQAGSVHSVVIKNLGDTKTSENLTDVINGNIDALNELDMIFKLSKQKPLKRVKVCISGNISNIDTINFFKDTINFNGKITKDVYIDILNSVFKKNGVILERKDSVSKETLIVINDSGEMHEKVRQGLKMGILYDSYKAIEILASYVRGGM